jgi:hypothetical protein
LCARIALADPQAGGLPGIGEREGDDAVEARVAREILGAAAQALAPGEPRPTSSIRSASRVTS